MYSFLPLVDEIPVSFVATHEIDDRPVYDHKTGERLARHLVKIGRRTECEAMVRHQLFERALIPLARGKKERCHWLDENKQGPDGPFVRSRLVSMEAAHSTASDLIHSKAQHLSNASRVSSRRLRRSRTREDNTLVCSPCTTSALRFGTRSYAHDEPIAMYPPPGEVEAGYVWENEAAMYGTRRASRLFQDHMKWVLGEAGDAALKACHQCLDADSMAAIHGDDIIAEGEFEELDRRDEALKRLVVVKVPDRIGPGAEEHGQYLKRHVHIEGASSG